MLILDSADRYIAASTDAILDQAILARTRAAITKSLEILRDSAPEIYLGKNYYELRAILPEASRHDPDMPDVRRP